MADFFFIVKSFLITLGLVVLMQIKIGETTIEDRAYEWIRGSAVHSTLSRVAAGAVTALNDGMQTVSYWISDEVPSAQKANR